jgi:site-specific DNA-methyltransferase (adenine-specific)
MRYQNSVHFSSVTVKHRTPKTLLAELYSEFHFDLDPCPIDYTPEEPDGLTLDWSGRRVYCNPPYGRGVANWLDKGPSADLAVFLLPARTDTIWFHRIVLPFASEIRFLQGRLKFGDGKGWAPFPSMIVVFRK